MSISAASMHGLGEPSPWVRHWAHLVAAGGAVLDVASGAGRHARFFASLGHPVTAIDRDAAALNTLADEPLVTPVVADLENAPWPLPAEAKFAAVVVTNYLHRPLSARLIESLAPGGVLVYETFAQGNERVGKPSNPAFLLAPGELLELVRGRLRVVAFQDGFLAQPRPAYVQRICAILEADRSGNPAQAAPPPCYELAG
ncbi:class I SAM-dependent methyltransferase [bacterium M00.F.Ca.ET.228.01.1.1]|uniref:class I SAM-dependent methyltransferase n=1 Tax=Paraburkholderia phenoliruptrix TaxID=252970 RepID=UPI001092CDDE|nr:class I SAM-dependent methyltransferase [Paraburkholderia phenoliruptrix]TGP41706.1 class I SAM-dependent methyltransferase [bacterium M00.F.Ca.ET.228.01.1.1]TGR98496.1 class I SAM-dependent methyltransferase [bacterium M00.F.Ca.ET.191.01.1.1]TGU02831.1 class I SAM-dependent methyltransferase [bacterium M00.F.Ca.ET.155.01.1.1]MBW0447500.1 class I SAM-dependent methyltransferase [Paraburkholderia phenoliruptrix]MBW9098297.1 class I SAM-dependent methyltransferase [Paraburkholderia phenolirup